MCYLFGTKSTMMDDMSLLDVKEFCTGILDAGARLADLVVVEYPNACLVKDALFGMTEVVAHTFLPCADSR